MDYAYATNAATMAAELLAIDSPTGFTDRAAAWVLAAFRDMGYPAELTRKGGVLADLGGQGDGLLLEAHTDTLGAMVAEVKASGRLRLTPLGGDASLQCRGRECPGVHPGRPGAGGGVPAVQRFCPRE